MAKLYKSVLSVLNSVWMSVKMHPSNLGPPVYLYTCMCIQNSVPCGVQGYVATRTSKPLSPNTAYFFLCFDVYTYLLWAPPSPRLLPIILYLNLIRNVTNSTCHFEIPLFFHLEDLFGDASKLLPVPFVLSSMVCVYSVCLAQPFIYWVIWDSSVFWHLWMNILWMFALWLEYFPLWEKFTSIQLLGRFFLSHSLPQLLGLFLFLQRCCT